MKRSWAIVFILSINLALVFFFWQNQAVQANQNGPIPQDAIRLRILANSDSPADQVVKRQVRDAVNQNITQWVQNLKSSSEAEQVIQQHLPELRQVVSQTLKRVHADPSFRIKIGQADFPTKMYGTYVYPAGRYHALVITLGSGQGANWWCVLFPPLCFLDFSNSEAVSPEAQKPVAQTASPTNVSAATEKNASTQVTNSENQARQMEKQQNQQQDSALPQAQKKSGDSDSVQVRFFVADLFTKLFHILN